MPWHRLRAYPLSRAALESGVIAQDPLTLFGANCIAWYKADTGVFKDSGTTPAANGDGVQQWNDQSGNGLNIIAASSGQRPTYQTAGFNSNKTLLFNGSGADTYLISTSNAVGMGAGATGAVFIVGQMASTTVSNGNAFMYYGNAQAHAYDNTASALMILRNLTNNSIRTYRNSGALDFNTAISLATNYRLGTVFDGSNATHYVNNAAGGSGANSDHWSSPGTIIVGGQSEFANNGWDGPISEVTLINTNPSPGQLASLDLYFRNKWGL